MLRVNVQTGETLAFDLATEEGREKWESFVSARHGEITGAALLHNKTLHTVPKPPRFRRVTYSAEQVISNRGKRKGHVIGERLICHVDSIEVSVTAYSVDTPKMVRVDVRNIGVKRHGPPN